MAEHEMTRKELQDQLDQANAQIAALKAESERPNPLLQAELQRAQEELARLKPAVAAKPAGEAPKRIPYKGWVQATEDCHYGFYRVGPQRNAKGEIVDAGDVFEVDLPCLWSDDPFVPVIVKGYTEIGARPITEPNPAAPQRIDFRFRPRVSPSTDMAPLRAGAY